MLGEGILAEVRDHMTARLRGRHVSRGGVTHRITDVTIRESVVTEAPLPESLVGVTGARELAGRTWHIYCRCQAGNDPAGDAAPLRYELRLADVIEVRRPGGPLPWLRRWFGGGDAPPPAARIDVRKLAAELRRAEQALLSPPV